MNVKAHPIKIGIGGLTEEQKTAFSYAIKDMQKGHRTLWVNRLKEEYPELYEYAKKKFRE